jgi:O-antigen/teichoic acid export membrane protein
MDGDIFQRIWRGLGANVYNQGVTIVVQLVGVPILLHAWGVQLYGEWLILFAIPAYLSMSDLGFSQSAGNDMTARVARGDRSGALAVFQSLGVLVYPITAAGLLLSAGLLWQLPLRSWFSFSEMGGEQARWVLWLLAAEVFARLPNGVNHAGFRASGDYALHVGLNSTTRLLQFTGVWIAASAGGGPVAAAAAFFGVRTLTTPAFAVLLVRRHRWLSFGLKHARKYELHRLLKPALANMAIPLAQALNIQGMVLVVGAVLGPLVVVVFSTLRTLTRLTLQLVRAVSLAAEPELATAYGAGKRALLQSLFVHALRAGLWLAFAAAAGLALFGSRILEVWTHGKVAMEPWLFAWLLTSAVASVLWYGALIVLKAANRHLRAALAFVVISAAALVLAALLITWTGSVATAGFSLLLMDAGMALYTLNAAAPLLGIGPVASFAQAVNPFPLVGLVLSRVPARR